MTINSNPVGFRKTVSPDATVSRVISRYHSRIPDHCTSVCTSNAKTGHEPRTKPAADDGFAAAVQAIMSLPLSDVEKAEAVRRLLAGR